MLKKIFLIFMLCTFVAGVIGYSIGLLFGASEDGLVFSTLLFTVVGALFGLAASGDLE